MYRFNVGLWKFIFKSKTTIYNGIKRGDIVVIKAHKIDEKINEYKGLGLVKRIIGLLKSKNGKL